MKFLLPKQENERMRKIIIKRHEGYETQNTVKKN